MLYACICILLLYAFQSSLLSKFFVNYYILQTKLGYGFHIYINGWSAFKGLPGDTVVKNQPAKAGDSGDTGLIPGSGNPPEEEMATHSSILAWEIPWT